MFGLRIVREKDIDDMVKNITNDTIEICAGLAERTYLPSEYLTAHGRASRRIADGIRNLKS